MFATCIFLAILQTCHVGIGGQTLEVEIADTQKTRDQGLMGRTHLPKGKGMMFVFEKPQILTFWMKNTLIPLSIAFFDEKKTLIEVVDMPVIPTKSERPPLFHSSKPALYAIEVPQNWFAEKRIESGAKFSFLDPSDRLE